MCELLWSDPQALPGRSPSKRGVGVAFGPDVTKRFLDANGLQLLVRSHEARPALPLETLARVCALRPRPPPAPIKRAECSDHSDLFCAIVVQAVQRKGHECIPACKLLAGVWVLSGVGGCR